MRKWEKRDLKAWRRQFGEVPHGARPDTDIADTAPAPNAPTLSPGEHLHGLWITLGLSDEEPAEKRERVAVE